MQMRRVGLMKELMLWWLNLQMWIFLMQAKTGEIDQMWDIHEYPEDY